VGFLHRVWYIAGMNDDAIIRQRIAGWPTPTTRSSRDGTRSSIATIRGFAGAPSGFASAMGAMPGDD
jgi:hypothetical protein